MDRAALRICTLYPSTRHAGACRSHAEARRRAGGYLDTPADRHRLRTSYRAAEPATSEAVSAQ